KSSSEILNEFGYWREDDFKLYCTISAKNTNSQGLSLKVNSDIDRLIEYSDRKSVGDFAVWELSQLHDRLLEKHRETFWVSAKTITEDGNEYFQYKEVEHTKKPIISQFDVLIAQGIITLDHLIKRNSNNKVVEKGPLFKIKPNSLDLLFPPSEKYSLM
ncbi:MAG: MvaI/BcnI family restriction endonuclease, partial [Bacteroidota bacterium]